MLIRICLTYYQFIYAYNNRSAIHWQIIIVYNGINIKSQTT